MKILSIGNFGHGWDGSICDEEHIAQALEELGHQVIRHQREEARHDNLVDVAPDFVLIAQWGQFPEDFMERAKRYYDCPLVYWAFDYQAEGQEWHERLVKEADLYLSKRIADSKYPNWQWLSQDFAPHFLQPLSRITTAPELHPTVDVLFTGSYLPWATERNEILKAIDNNFNLVIHSVNEWPRFKDVRGPIMDDGLPGLYARAKCILSIDHTIEAGYWSDRNAQIIACGRKPLFRYVPLSEVRFGDRVDYFYSVEDCFKKVQQHINNPLYEHRIDNLYVTDRVRDLLTIVEGIL